MRSPRQHLRCIAGLAWLVLAAGPWLVPPGAAAEVRLFRPLSAHPREAQSSWRLTSYTTDWRYGSDIGDSTSRGGIEEDVTGVGWDAAAGETFLWRPLERMLGRPGPWKRYQVGVMGGMFVTFDNTGSLLNADYRFGLVLEMLWAGDFADGIGVTGFERPVVTSRLGFSHNSSHIGDEYITHARFSRNRNGLGALSPHPPVKRVELTYETLEGVLSIEWASPAGDGSTLRAYAGGERKAALPSHWEVGGTKPAGYDAPAAHLGLEWRDQGDAARPAPGPIGMVLQRVLRDPSISSEWFAAIDLRLAKPYDFASCDNPNGDGEVWTPSLATECLHSHPFENYAGSWHGRVGLALSRRGSVTPRRLVAPELLVTLDWYRGYSPNGQFQDQRLRYRPRWILLPAVTAHF